MDFLPKRLVVTSGVGRLRYGAAVRTAGPRKRKAARTKIRTVKQPVVPRA